MNQFSEVFIAYLVSWSKDIVYAEALIDSDPANINVFGGYDFSTTSNKETCYGYTLSEKSSPWTSENLLNRE